MKQPSTIALITEIWKPVIGWEGLYSVSDHGRVRSEPREIIYPSGHTRMLPAKIRKLSTATISGYKMVTLKCKGRKQETSTVHRLVMMAFVGPYPNGMNVCHENGVRTDNRLVNLRYDTQSSNMYDKRRHGTDHEVNKTHCKRAGHPLKGANLAPWQLVHGRRECLACSRASSRVWHNPHLKPFFQEIADAYYAEIIKQPL